MTERPTGTHIEIVEYSDDPSNVRAVLFGKQGEIRINGQRVFASDEHPVKIRGGSFGKPLLVTLTLIADSLHIQAEKPPVPIVPGAQYPSPELLA